MRELAENMLAKLAHLIASRLIQTQRNAKPGTKKECHINSYVLSEQYPEVACCLASERSRLQYLISVHTSVPLKIDDAHVPRVRPFDSGADRVNSSEVGLSII
jgi:hypothetical protein